MYSREDIERLCTNYYSNLIAIKCDEIHIHYNYNIVVTVQCCVPECMNEIHKSLRNLFKKKNFVCLEHMSEPKPNKRCKKDLMSYFSSTLND